MKYIRDNCLSEVLPVLARNPGWSIEIRDNETRKVIDTTKPDFIPSKYKVLEVRSNEMFIRYEVYVELKKEK